MSTPAAPLSTGVHVVIPAALNRPTHTLYSVCVRVQPTLQEWCVNRRYSQFLQLRDDVLATLRGCQSGCPSCASFALSINKFAFPRKTWIRTNRIVRKRVKSLQLFLQLLAQRLFHDLPKCSVCGDQVKKMVRPFLIRGAQPMGDATVDKIQHSLSLLSYAIVDHKSRKQHKQSPHELTKNSSENETSDTSTERSGSDAALESPTPAVDLSASGMSDDSYGQQYGDERCTDQAVPLAEAMKQVVLLDKRSSTVEEVAFRLSSMWDAYDLDDVMAAAPELKLSFTEEAMEENETEDTGTEEEGIDILGGDTEDEDENNASLALLQDDNNGSFAVLQDENMYDEHDDDEREAEPLPIDEVTL